MAISPIEYPSPPQEPTVVAPRVDAGEKAGAPKRTKKTEKVATILLKIKIHLGDKTQLMGEVEIPESYTFTHKKGQLSYTQTIAASAIRELMIEGYRGHKAADTKEGEVVEFEPSRVRVEMKDGQAYNLGYLFKPLRQIKVKTADGNVTVFSFFADTWQKKNGWRDRGGEEFVLASKRAHPGAYTRIEYFEPVERAGEK